MNHNLIKYTIHLADDCLIMSQRLAEWTGHGPALEQDIALTNLALDYLGQGRNFYQYAAQCINEQGNPDAWVPGHTGNVDEDALAYHRPEHLYGNHLLVELPNGHWGQTVLKVYFLSVFQQLLYQELLDGNDVQIAAIAEKSLKEVKYHVKWSRDWVLRLGDGTAASNAKMAEALGGLWPFVGELFEKTPWNATFVNLEKIQPGWVHQVSQTLREAALELPKQAPYQTGGLKGMHTEHLGFILAEMQYLQRVYPGKEW